MDEALTYTLDVDIQPKVLKVGDSVTIMVKVENANKPIKAVYATIPEYGIWKQLTPANSGYYRGFETVPWGAPSGTYNLQVYAIDENNKKGPVKVVQVTIG